MDLKNNSDILQNLKDSGCTREFIEEFFRLKELGSERLILQLLYKHKKQLLDCLHKAQREIDCLDYLIYHLSKPPG